MAKVREFENQRNCCTKYQARQGSLVTEEYQKESQDFCFQNNISCNEILNLSIVT